MMSRSIVLILVSLLLMACGAEMSQDEAPARPGGETGQSVSAHDRTARVAGGAIVVLAVPVLSGEALQAQRPGVDRL